MPPHFHQMMKMKTVADTLAGVVIVAAMALVDMARVARALHQLRQHAAGLARMALAALERKHHEPNQDSTTRELAKDD